MAPITHIIRDHGTQVDCGNQLAVMYHLEGKWFEVDQDLRRTQPDPMVLDANDPSETVPMTKIVPISAHGVYTQQDMDAFQQTLLFPNERRALTNIMTRRVIGAGTDGQDFHLPDVFSKYEFAKMAWSAAAEVWGFLSYTGNLFSVFMLLYTLYHVLRYVASVILNFFSLRRAANNQPQRRWFFLASLWDAMTTRYLVNLLHQRETEATNSTATESLAMSLPNIGSSVSLYPGLQQAATHPPPYVTGPPADTDILRQPVA